jgi:hypothetical protein
MPDVVLTTRVLDRSYLLWKMHLYQGMLIPRQSYHNDYAYPSGRISMLDGDGMTSNTQVPAVRCTWVPMPVSCHARHLMSPLPKNLAPLVLIRC